MEAEYDGTIFSLFAILDIVFRENNLPDKIIRNDILYSSSSKSQDMQAELFDKLADDLPDDESGKELYLLKSSCTAYRYFESCRNSFSGQEIIKYSGKAYKDILYAWMSELPIEREIIYFAWKVVSAGRMEDAEIAKCGDKKPGKRVSAAEKARCDLADVNIKKVMEAASRARKESHFLLGILRFSVGTSGVPIARCSPDYFVLPTLAHHFSLRFGSSPWAIIDERRNISLIRTEEEWAKLMIFNPGHPWFKESFDDWEKMWKNYHSSINNESRSNPNLQRRFIPVRYWKYLPELQDK